jgi:RecA/RadA recombinase
LPVLVLLVAIIAGVILYSDSAVPGDTLYPVDTATEKVWETFTLDSAAQARLRNKFAAERVTEVNKLVAKGSVQEVNIGIVGLEGNLRDAVDSTKKLTHQTNAPVSDELSDSIGNAIEVIQSIRASGKFSQDEGEFLGDVQDYLKIEKKRVDSNQLDMRTVLSKLAQYSDESGTGSSFADQRSKDLTVKAGDQTDSAKANELKLLAELEKNQSRLFAQQAQVMQKESVHLQNS